jgi:hypothetical protein
MEIALFEAIIKVLAEIKNFKISRTKNKERVFNAVEKIREAANKTKHYYASLKNDKEEPNINLSQTWMEAARAVRELDQNLYQRLLDKADFWANPNNWTTEMLEARNIYLDEIIEDVDRILKKQ